MPLNSESKTWNLSNTIMAAMGAIIVLLLGTGILSIRSQINDGDTLIRVELKELKDQYKDSNKTIVDFVKELGIFKTELAIIKTNQVARMEKERLEAEHKARKGVRP